MEWIDGYKVVRRQGSRFVSVFMGKFTNVGWKVYVVGRITKRTPGFIKHIKSKIRAHGPLAVFWNKDDALRFMEKNWIDGDCADATLFKCRYIESQAQDYWSPGYRQRNLCQNYAPGQRFADAVELIEEVE